MLLATQTPRLFPGRAGDYSRAVAAAKAWFFARGVLPLFSGRGLLSEVGEEITRGAESPHSLVSHKLFILSRLLGISRSPFILRAAVLALFTIFLLTMAKFWFITQTWLYCLM